MTTETRRAVAYIAARFAAGVDSRAVYDHTTTLSTPIDGTVTDEVSVYDHEAGCFMTGHLPSLYHYGTNKYLSLRFQDSTFYGFDCATRSHFRGVVDGRNVSLYDYGEYEYFDYSV